MLAPTVPTLIPILVCGKLDEMWTTELPSQAEERELACLTRSVQMLDEVQVAHADLVPANIMWRCVEGLVRLRTVDFEAVLFFGSLVLLGDMYRGV